MKTTSFKHKSREKVLEELIIQMEMSNDPDYDFVIVSTQVFFDYFDEKWTFVINYHE